MIFYTNLLLCSLHLSSPFIFLCLPTGKGGKNRRKGKNDTEDKRELVFKEFGHGNLLTFVILQFYLFPLRALLEYGQIVKMLGSGHMEVQCFDGEKRIAHIRGKMRKKVK